jgi:succinoglycan biosynthesis transport protein ExoP
MMTTDSTIPTTLERLRQAAHVLRRRWLVAVAMVAISVVVAVVVAAQRPAQYQATAKLLMTNSDVVAIPRVTPGSSGNVDPERDINTKIGLVRLESIARRVDEQLRLHMPVDELTAKVSATSEGASNLVDIGVTDSQASRAAAIANAFASEYVKFRRVAAQSALQQAASDVSAQLKGLTSAEQRSAQAAALRSQLRTLKLETALQTGGAEIVLAATPPASATGAGLARAGILGGVIGLILALIAIAALEITDRRIRDEDVDSHTLGPPILAHIPRTSTRTHAGMLVNGDRGQNDGYDRLAGQLTLAARRDSTEVVLVTSSGPGDGKTSIVLGVARALAHQDLRVVVLETDSNGPIRRGASMSEPSPPSGLEAVLSGGVPLAAALVELDPFTLQAGRRSGDIDGAIHVLSAGPSLVADSRLLAHPEIARVIRESRALADVVLVDAPPATELYTALPLLDEVDAALVVSRLRWTTTAAVNVAVQTLEAFGTRVLGVVATGTRRGAPPAPAFRGTARSSDEPPSHSALGGGGFDRN